MPRAAAKSADRPGDVRRVLEVPAVLVASVTYALAGWQDVLVTRPLCELGSVAAMFRHA